MDGEKNRGAVLICPGGGYGYTSAREAEPIAMQFNSAGFHAFVLYYSVAPNRHPQALLDASRAICLIRENAEEWNVEVEKITVCGFSAGGHLAASLGVLWNRPYIQNHAGINGRNYPNAMILCYPVISSGEFAHRESFDNLLGEAPSTDSLFEVSIENQINKDTPPAFLWHTVQDKLVPVENTMLMAKQLRAHNIPFELHIFPEGPHGLSLATDETVEENMENYPQVAKWMQLCIEWLKNV